MSDKHPPPRVDPSKRLYVCRPAFDDMGSDASPVVPCARCGASVQTQPNLPPELIPICVVCGLKALEQGEVSGLEGREEPAGPGDPHDVH